MRQLKKGLTVKNDESTVKLEENRTSPQQLTLRIFGLEALFILGLVGHKLQADVAAVDNGMSVSFFNIAKIVGLLVLLFHHHIITVLVTVFLAI